MAPDDDFDDPEVEFRPLSAQQAQALREKNPSVSPWRVIALQLACGALTAVVAWAVTGQREAGWSAGYGSLAVVIPAGVFARGLTGRLASLGPSSALIGFFVWELVKMALTFAMLLAAPKLVSALNWPAMLVGLALTMQVYWVALAFVSKPKTII